MSFRTRFAKDIVTEFLPPSDHRSRRVVIFCGGMPGVPCKDDLMEFWARNGYWTFFPRYRGTWESGGKFLKKSPHEDLLDVIDGLAGGFKEAWTQDPIHFNPSQIFLIGSSFGGAAVLLAARDERVQKVVALSPVVDWSIPSKEEPLGEMPGILNRAFGEAYRFDRKDWDKLGKGDFYNPLHEADKIPGKKAWIIHAKDDEVVPYEPSVELAKATGAKLTLLKKGGHLSSSLLLKKRYADRLLEMFQ